LRWVVVEVVRVRLVVYDSDAGNDGVAWNWREEREGDESVAAADWEIGGMHFLARELKKDP
jgi:hypothetical protein